MIASIEKLMPGCCVTGVTVLCEKAVSARGGGCLGSKGDICKVWSNDGSVDDCDDLNKCGPFGPSTGLRSKGNGILRLRPELESGVGASSYEETVVWLLRLLSSCVVVRSTCRIKTFRTNPPNSCCPSETTAGRALPAPPRIHYLPRHQCRKSPWLQTTGEVLMSEASTWDMCLHVRMPCRPGLLGRWGWLPAWRRRLLA